MTAAERREYQNELNRLLTLQCETFLKKKGDYVQKNHKRIKQLREILKEV